MSAARDHGPRAKRLPSQRARVQQAKSGPSTGKQPCVGQPFAIGKFGQRFGKSGTGASCAARAAASLRETNIQVQGAARRPSSCCRSTSCGSAGQSTRWSCASLAKSCSRLRVATMTRPEFSQQDQAASRPAPEAVSAFDRLDCCESRSPSCSSRNANRLPDGSFDFVAIASIWPIPQQWGRFACEKRNSCGFLAMTKMILPRCPAAPRSPVAIFFHDATRGDSMPNRGKKPAASRGYPG